MSPESWLAAGAIVSAFITALGAYLSARRASGRMAEMERRKLSGEEFDRSKAITDDIINELRKEVDRLKAQVRELRETLGDKRSENQALLQQVRQLTATANALRHQIRVLERQLNGA